jgi:uncharacterized membrane protein YphA (DoxX/SURF4 family)
MTVRTRIALRVLAGALLIIAGVKFMFTMIASFQTEERVPRGDGGYQIDHIFEINHWAVVLGLAGGVLLVISFLGGRAPARPDEI